MADINITINTDNEAFADHCGSEVARILRVMATRFERTQVAWADGDEWPVRDVNGKTVGTVEVLP